MDNPSLPSLLEDDDWGMGAAVNENIVKDYNSAFNCLELIIAYEAMASFLQEITKNNDGFVIPSLGIEENDESKPDSEAEDTKKSFVQEKEEENIYLGPHGAPPSHSKQEQNSSNRKQKFKQILREADQRSSESGRENKVDNLRELVGAGKRSSNTSKGSPRDWLDPHCHESEFERKYS